MLIHLFGNNYFSIRPFLNNYYMIERYSKRECHVITIIWLSLGITLELGDSVSLYHYGDWSVKK